MSALGQRVSDFTLQKIMPLVTDTILNENVLATKMLKKAKKFPSYQIEKPIKVRKGTPAEFFSGFDTLNRSAEKTEETLTVNPSNISKSVVLPSSEITYNKAGAEKVIDLIRYQTESAAQDLADAVGTSFYGDGTNTKEFVGLEGIVDDGTNLATYFGLSRSTYTTLQSTVDSSSNVLSLSKMTSLYSDISESSSSLMPTDIYTTPAIHALYESIANDANRINLPITSGQTASANLGFNDLGFKGMEVSRDSKATDGVMYMVNDRFLNFYFKQFYGTEAINTKSAIINGNDYSNFPSGVFGWTGWQKAYDQHAFAGDIILSGQMFSENPKRHGKLTGITTV